jgi:hypothetical protein
MLVAVAALRSFNAFLAPDEGLVRLDGVVTAQRSQRTVAHSLTNAVRHEPRRLERHTKGPVELVGADALLAGAEQVEGHQPLVEWNMAALENGALGDAEELPAVPTLPSARLRAGTLQLHDPIGRATVRAHRAIGPEMDLDEQPGCFLIMEMRGFEHGHGNLLRRGGYHASWVKQV